MNSGATRPAHSKKTPISLMSGSSDLADIHYFTPNPVVYDLANARPASCSKGLAGRTCPPVYARGLRMPFTSGPDTMSDSTATGNFEGQLTGRCGFITYQESNRELRVYWEISGSPTYDILVSPDFRAWSNASNESLSEEKQLSLLRALRSWLKAQNRRSDIDRPADLSEEPSRCLWAGCSNNKLKTYYYCRYHLDLSCLRG